MTAKGFTVSLVLFDNVLCDGVVALGENCDNTGEAE